jgi:hypothetical protein
MFMFEFIKKLFRRSKDKEETAMEDNSKKVELTALTPDRSGEETEVPASRYTEEYAEFNQQQLEKAAAESAERTAPAAEEESLEEQMLADPFADVAAQDEDVEVPAIEEPAPEAGEEAAPTEEEILADPFADVAAQDEDPE